MASGLTPTYLLPYPLQTDSVDVANDMKLLAEASETAFSTKASLASPALTGTPTAPTAAVNTNTTQIATTQFVINQGYLKSASATALYAPLISPTFTGIPIAPTAALGTNTTQIATTQYVQTELSNFVTLPSQSGASGKFLTSNGTSASWKTLSISDVSGLESTFTDLASLYSPLNIPISSKTSNYILQSSDSSKQIEMNVATANTVIVKLDLPMPIGANIVIVQTGTGQTSIVVDSGVTINATPGLKLRAQWSVATLTKRAANTWLLAGDIVA